MGDDKRRPYQHRWTGAEARPTPLRRRMPTRTRPSGTRHGRRQASPLRIGGPALRRVPRLCGVACRPERCRRETGMGDDAPCGRDSVRRQAWASPLRPEQLGDEARVGATLAVAHPATLAVAHPESSTASFPSCEVASHAFAASRTDPNDAFAVASGNRHGRRQASPLRIGGPALRRVPRLCGVACRPERCRRETGMGDDKRRPYASVDRR